MSEPSRGLTLVTGATGFTGSHLVRALVRDRERVRVIARSAARAGEILPGEVDIVEGDIAAPGLVERAMEGVATVYHLAAVYREAKHPDWRYREVNVEASRRLLDAAVASGVRRYLHCSTVGVHGNITSPPGDERTAYGPGDIYQETKCEA
jgi:nucleoside-diphosphate-sugar epimerase